MDLERAKALVTAYVEGWKNNDLDRILGTLELDCLIIESHGPTYKSTDHVRAWVTSWFEDGGSIQQWDITSFVFGEDHAAFEWTFQCSGSWGTATFDGATVVRFGDQRIQYLREYRCTHEPFLWSPEPENRRFAASE